MTKGDYVADIKRWIETATEKQTRLLWVFAKNYLKK